MGSDPRICDSLTPSKGCVSKGGVKCGLRSGSISDLGLYSKGVANAGRPLEFCTSSGAGAGAAGVESDS
jgi:hypothetical protein